MRAGLRAVLAAAVVSTTLTAVPGCSGGARPVSSPPSVPTSSASMSRTTSPPAGAASTSAASSASTSASAPGSSPARTTQSGSPSGATSATSTQPSTAPSGRQTAVACTNATRLASWPLRRLAEQTVVVPVDEAHVERVTAQVAAGAGGVILFGSRAPSTLRTSLARLVARAPGGIRPFVMSDEEGGAVQRMANLVGTMPSARTMAATMTTAQIEALALRVGQRMRALGVTMDLAPVLDLDARPGPSATNPDGTRSFSADPARATAAGLAFARGLRRAGIVAVVKHFPGLGGATGNTDVKPAATKPWSVLQAKDLKPFAAAVAAGIPAVMIANARVRGLTSLPASLSSAVITTVLRGRLHFLRLVVTDALSAGAVSAAGYSVPRAAVRALAVGADLLVWSAPAARVASVTEQTVTAIVSAVQTGALSRARLREAVLHILAAKHVNLCR